MFFCQALISVLNGGDGSVAHKKQKEMKKCTFIKCLLCDGYLYVILSNPHHNPAL